MEWTFWRAATDGKGWEELMMMMIEISWVSDEVVDGYVASSDDDDDDVVVSEFIR